MQPVPGRRLEIDSRVDATTGGMELMEVMGERRARAGATLAKAKGGKSEGYWLVRCQPPPTVSAHCTHVL